MYDEQRIWVEEQMDYYLQNYEIIADYNCNPTNGHKVYVDSDAQKPYVCRFCGKTEPEVRFTDDAHAISDLTGNRSLFLKSECDNCNRRYGKFYEDQFAKYLGPARTLSQTRGKRGVPSYKTKDEDFRIDVTSNCFVIQEMSDNRNIDFNENNIEVHLPKDTYEPIKVFKALVFMALSIIPRTELKEFEEAIDWLKDTEEMKYNMHNYTSQVSERFIEGAKPLPVRATVGRRKQGKEVPYSFFSLVFDNYVFQIVMPCPRQDEMLLGQRVTFPLYPVKADIDMKMKSRKQGFAFRDWSSREPIKGEKLEMNLKFGYREEIKGDYEAVSEVAEKAGVKPLKPKKRDNTSI